MRSYLLTTAAMALAAMAAMSSSARALTLEEAVQQAIVFHPRIQRDEALEQVAQRNIEVAYSGYLPRVDIDSALGVEATNSPTTRTATGGWRDFVRYDNEIRLTQLLLDGGATPGAVAASRSAQRAATADLRETSELIAIDSVQLYLNVLRDRTFVAIAEDNVAAHEEITERIRGLAQAGRGADADVAQAESRLALARSTLETNRGGLREVVARYTETVGIAPADLEPASVSSLTDYSEPASVDEAIAIAMGSNPSVIASAERVEQAEHEIRIARAEYYPTFSAEVFGTHNDNVDGTPGKSSDANARVRAEWNVFNGFGDLARTRREEQERNAAEGTFNDEARRVREETRIVWDDLVTARDRVVPVREHVAAQERVLLSYQNQFDVGRRSLLDLLDAQNELFNAKVELADSEFAVDVAEYELIFTTGRLLDLLGVVVPSEEDSFFRGGG